MAAPAATSRVEPVAFKLRNGYQALMTLSLDPDVKYFEIGVGVPGIDSGDAIDTTTQLNSVFRTFAPRSLLTLTEFQVTAAYSVAAYTELFNLVGLDQTVTITFPDGSTLAFYAFLKTVEFDQMVDGTMPQMTLTIVPTNYDRDHCVEAGPVLVDLGTC